MRGGVKSQEYADESRRNMHDESRRNMRDERSAETHEGQGTSAVKGGPTLSDSDKGAVLLVLQ